MPKALALRCGHDVVTTGDSKLEVLRKCGEPMLEERHFEEFRASVDTGLERRSNFVVDEWTYNFSTHDLLYFLKFVNGTLVDTEKRTASDPASPFRGHAKGPATADPFYLR